MPATGYNTGMERFQGYRIALLPDGATERQFRQSAAEQAGLKLALVWPRGTSAWAYDGSGKVIRSRKNYSLCRLPSGRWYNADLNAASNIAARYLARALGIAPRNRAAVSTGKSSGLTTRMPWVLADLWRHAGAPV